MRRREFFGASAGLGAVLGLAGAPADARLRGRDGAVGLAQVRELRGALLSLYALDDAYGGDDVLVLGVRHLRRVRRVIDTGSYPEAVGRQLRLVAGETAEHCGWLSFDAGRQDDALRFWGDALATARTLGDDGLEVVVLASLSLQARYDNQAREAYEFARAAQDRAAGWASPKLLSVLVEREADASARMRDHLGARQALSRAIRLLERDTGSHPTPAWASFQGPAELSHAQGFLFAEAGHYKAAIPYVQAALAQQDSTYGRNSALYRLDLAEMLINSGEVDEGCAEAVSAARQFGEVASGRVRKKLAVVRYELGHIDAKARPRHSAMPRSDSRGETAMNNVTGMITVQRYGMPQAAKQLERILPVYEEVYAEAPYREGPREVAEFLDRLGRQLNRPGFRLVTAAADAGVIGFSFGFLLPADTRWWQEELKPLPRKFTRETGRRTFAIIELAVRAAFRRRGVANRIHAALIDGLTAERVTLAVRPEAEAAPARAAYAALGYRKVGQARPGDGAPIYDTMMLDLARVADRPVGGPELAARR